MSAEPVKGEPTIRSSASGWRASSGSRLSKWRGRIEASAAGLDIVEDLLHFVVAAVLVGVAMLILVHTTLALAGNASFATRVDDGITGSLLVIIVVELLQTVVAHFRDAGFQLEPFLIIGMISAVRHVLTLGARASLAGNETATTFNRTQIELGVSAGVVLALSIALVLLRRAPARPD